MKRYSDWKNGHEPFYPDHLLKQALIVALMIAVLIVAVSVYSLYDIEIAASVMKPQWYMLPIYKIASILKGAGGFIVSAIFFVILLMWPYIDRKPEKNILGRPALLAVSILVAALLVSLGIWGMF